MEKKDKNNEKFILELVKWFIDIRTEMIWEYTIDKNTPISVASPTANIINQLETGPTFAMTCSQNSVEDISFQSRN